ncbi:MAG: sugar transferase [Sphingomonas sp.]
MMDSVWIGAEGTRTPATPLRLADRNGIAFDGALTRVLDVTVSLLGILFLAPLMVLIMAVIFMTDFGPVVYGHVRIGRGGRSFRCLKFRSMVTDSDARLRALLERDETARREWEQDHKLRNDPRITRIGSFLRRSSLDELPQLFNVLRGEMSLVGPRPIVAAEQARYGRYMTAYCTVRPGITGLWQVSGRNDVSYRRRVAMDVTYARSQNFWMNVRILALTVPCVLKQRGSY